MVVGFGLAQLLHQPFAAELCVGRGLGRLEGFGNDEDERGFGVEARSLFGEVFGIDVGNEADLRTVGRVVAQRIPDKARAEV